MNKNIRSKRISKVAFWHLVKYVSLLIVFVLGILGMASTPPPNDVEIQKVYILAFVEENSNRIRVRWSKDGQTWSNGNFPNQTTSVGVGAVSGAEGALNVVLWTDSSNVIQAIWGLGTTTWDTRPGGPSLDQAGLSAPTAAYAGEGLYLVAFRTTGNVVAVRSLNVQSKTWLTVSLAPAHSSNSSVVDRPAIAIANGKVVLAWNRRDFASGVNIGMNLALGDLHIATVGGEKVPIINWTNYQTLITSETGITSVINSPALTYAGNKWYLGCHRKTRRISPSGDVLLHSMFWLYESSDGITWNPPGETPSDPLNLIPNLAGRSDGSVLAAIVGGGKGRKLYKYTDGTRSEILNTRSDSADQVFGWIPAYLMDFGLISNKP